MGQLKLFNSKKIAFVSALIVGGVVSLDISAQTNLVTSFPTGTARNPAGTTITGTGVGGANMGPYSNSFGITAGRSYTLTYGLSGSVPNGGLSFTSLASSGGTRIVVSGGSGIGLVTGTGNIVSISASSIAALAGGNAYLYAFSGVGASNIVLTINSLIEDSVAPTGPSVANTQASVANTAQALQSTYTLQNAVLANSFSYDCTVFGENNICVSAGGRNTAVSAANGLNNTSALLIAAYRAMANVRVGAYADQNLSVNNAGSTVNLANNTPLIGIFGAWNERLDGTGTEVKVSAAYGQKNSTMNRSVVGADATASEAGSGSSKLNSQGAQITAKYGFSVMSDVVVSPYAGIRYTQNNMGGYTESASVTTPLTYSALNTNATTALAGVGASYKGIPQAILFASAGVETDTNTANGSYNATGLTGLTPVNFNPSPARTRPTAMLGAYYDIEKNQRLGLNAIYRQEAYQAVSSITVMATYTVGL